MVRNPLRGVASIGNKTQRTHTSAVDFCQRTLGFIAVIQHDPRQHWHYRARDDVVGSRLCCVKTVCVCAINTLKAYTTDRPNNRVVAADTHGDRMKSLINLLDVVISVVSTIVG